MVKSGRGHFGEKFFLRCPRPLEAWGEPLQGVFMASSAHRVQEVVQRRRGRQASANDRTWARRQLAGSANSFKCRRASPALRGVFNQEPPQEMQGLNLWVEADEWLSRENADALDWADECWSDWLYEQAPERRFEEDLCWEGRQAERETHHDLYLTRGLVVHRLGHSQHQAFAVIDGEVVRIA